MCWLDDSHVAVSGIGHDDDAMIAGVEIFDAATGTTTARFAGPSGPLHSDGRRLYSSGTEGLEPGTPRQRNAPGKYPDSSRPAITPPAGSSPPSRTTSSHIGQRDYSQEPIDRTEPEEPIDRIDPLHPMLKMEPEDLGQSDELTVTRIRTFWQQAGPGPACPSRPPLPKRTPPADHMFGQRHERALLPW